MAAKRKATKSSPNRRNLPPGASPRSGVVPPPEHRFQPGNTAGVGHGRPRKMADLKELIIETLAEEVAIADADGQRSKITRARAMIRMMLIKSPSDRIALLEYAFGKVPQAIKLSGDEDGAPIEIKAVETKAYDHRTLLAALSPGSVENSPTPGEGEGVDVRAPLGQEHAGDGS